MIFFSEKETKCLSLEWEWLSDQGNSIAGIDWVLFEKRITETLKLLLVDVLLLLMGIFTPHASVDTEEWSGGVVLEDFELFIIMWMVDSVLLKLWAIHGLSPLIFYRLPFSTILADNLISQHPSMLAIIANDLEWLLLVLKIIEGLCPDDDSLKNHLIGEDDR